MSCYCGQRSCPKCGPISHNEGREIQRFYSPEPFVTKVEGPKEVMTSGMTRCSSKGKPRYDLIYKPMLKRWAELMSRGADIHGARNWEKADSQVEFERFLESANRHFEQWIAGDNDEDHAAAVMFNIAAAEMMKTEKKFSIKNKNNA